MTDRSRAVSAEIRAQAIAEFVATWLQYSSPSQAALVIAQKHDVGRTTLAGWLRADGLWPYTRVAANLQLAAENLELRRELDQLRQDRP